MMKSGRILVGFDGSAYAKKAVNYVINNFDRGSSVCLVYVEQSLASMYLSTESPLIDDSMIKRMKNKAENELGKEAAYIQKKGFSVKYVYLEGYPSEEILKEARKEKADIIIIGSRGMSRWKGSLLGSVSQALAVNSGIPLLIIR